MLDWDLRRVGKGAEQDRELNKYSRAAPCPRVEWWARPRAHSAHTNEAHCGAVFGRARLCAPYSCINFAGALACGGGAASWCLKASRPADVLSNTATHGPRTTPFHSRPDTWGSRLNRWLLSGVAGLLEILPKILPR